MPYEASQNVKDGIERSYRQIAETIHNWLVAQGID
jgi:hypothetical protein